MVLGKGGQAVKAEVDIRSQYSTSSAAKTPVVCRVVSARDGAHSSVMLELVKSAASRQALDP